MRRRFKVQFDVANRLFFRLYQCSNQLHKHGTRYVDSFGVTTQQWAVIGALARPIAREKGVSVKDLIEFLQLSRQNLSAVLDRLEANDWIERVRGIDDGRRRHICLTPSGEARWQEMQAVITRFYDDALKGLSEEEQVQLYRLLDRLKTGFNAL